VKFKNDDSEINSIKVSFLNNIQASKEIYAALLVGNSKVDSKLAKENKYFLRSSFMSCILLKRDVELSLILTSSIQQIHQFQVQGVSLIFFFLSCKIQSQKKIIFPYNSVVFNSKFKDIL